MPLSSNQEANTGKLYTIQTGIYWRFKLYLDIREIFRFYDFINDFRQMVKFDNFRSSKKIQTVRIWTGYASF